MANKRKPPLCGANNRLRRGGAGPESGKYWHLNSTAAQMHDELQTEATPGALVLLWPHTGSVPETGYVMSLRPSHHFYVRYRLR